MLTNVIGRNMEFLLVGPAKAGKTTVAKRLAERFQGAYFNLSVFNRIIAWWVLKSREKGRFLDISDRERFLAVLEQLTSTTNFDPSGRVLHCGVDITEEIETVDVSLQASKQSDLVYREYRDQLTIIIWNAIAQLRHNGPVFIVARRRRSARTARRAVYLDASRTERAARLCASDGSLSLSTAAELILRRDLSEKTFLEADDCDVVIDSSGCGVEETVDAVAAEYEKACLVATMNFYGLRPRVALDRTAGQKLLQRQLRDKSRFLLCCADLDYQGMLKNAFGKQVDLLSYLLSTLSSAARECGGVPVIWGSDDILILFPYEGCEREALARLDRVRHGYLYGNAGRLGIGVITTRNEQTQPASPEEVALLGEFTGRFAGEDLFPFEVWQGASLEEAFRAQLDELNCRLAHIGITLSGYPKCLAPTSSVTLGGVLVDGTKTDLDADELVDAAYGAMQDAKSRGKNCSYLFRLDELNTGYRFRGQPLVADHSVVAEISRQPDDQFVIPKADRREHYPYFHNITALERLVTSWLRETSDRNRSVILLYPGFAGDAILNALRLLASKGEVPENAATDWVLPHGYWFKALSRVFSQQNRDIMIRAAAHYQDLAVRDWVRNVNRSRGPSERIRLARLGGRPLRGLRLALECFWFIEGACNDGDALLLLNMAQRRLASKIPGLSVKVLGMTASLDGVVSARDVFRQVDVFREFVMDPRHHFYDVHGNVLVRVEITADDLQITEDREEAQQENNLRYLREDRGDIKVMTLLSALERELWRCHRRVANLLEGSRSEGLIRALTLVRLLRRMESWAATDIAALLHYLLQSGDRHQVMLACVLHACFPCTLREEVQTLLPGASLACIEQGSVHAVGDAVEALGVLLRFASTDGLMPFGFVVPPEPLTLDDSLRMLRGIFGQIPEIACDVWGQGADSVCQAVCMVVP